MASGIDFSSTFAVATGMAGELFLSRPPAARSVVSPLAEHPAVAHVAIMASPPRHDRNGKRMSILKEKPFYSEKYDGPMDVFLRLAIVSELSQPGAPPPTTKVLSNKRFSGGEPFSLELVPPVGRRLVRDMKTTHVACEPESIDRQRGVCQLIDRRATA